MTSLAGTSPRLDTTCSIKGHRLGTDRLIDPEATLLRAQRAMRAAGVTRISNLTGLDTVGVPVVAAIRPNSRSIAVSQGKGLTLEAAKASAVMEAIESYHAETAILPLRHCSYAEVSSLAAVVDVQRLPKVGVVHFTERTPLLWTEAEDIARGERVFVPYEMVHTNYTLPLPAGSGCFLMSSNGLASGNHILEAISHAICELVERDAVTLHGFSSESARRERRLDLTSVTDASCVQVLEAFEAAGLAVSVHDVTSDVNIPVFRCDVAERADSAFRTMPPLRGTGCHPRREIALLRALTEAAQTRVTMISGARDDLSPWWYMDRNRTDSARRAFLEEHARVPRRAFQDAPHFDSPTLEGDVLWQIRRLQLAGLDSVLTVDLSRPELGIAVARVIVPGLEPMREAPGYSPGKRAQQTLLARPS